MNRTPSEQLMTVEEAERLSRLDADPSATREESKRARLWSWQSVEGAMSQTVSDEQLERMKRAGK
ncbi:MAG TPA: hypothetical protein VF161_11830 [Steroidobacteraceae bacterium]|jgi:hypothetical protein